MYLDRDGYYTPRGNPWNPGDGSDKNIGTTRFFFRKIFSGRDYEIAHDDQDEYALRHPFYRD